MNVSTRYTVALHILTLLASGAGDGHPMTSEYIAGSVNTNPVVIRRLLGRLRAAGLVGARPGVGGGWVLRQAAEKITLDVVRAAMEEGAPFSMHAQAPNPRCPVGKNIQRVLDVIFTDAEQAMCESLSRSTIEGLLAAIRKCGDDRGNDL